MSVGVLLAHGWCFGRDMWTELKPLLHADYCVTPDFGYFCEPEMPVKALPRPLIGVGHSFGFLWLMKQKRYLFDGVVNISAVPGFCETYGDTSAVSNSDLINARSHISRSPSSFVNWFHKKCGMSLGDRRRNPTCINVAKILRDLECLATWNVENELQVSTVPIRVLGSNTDKVVRSCILKESFKGFSSIDLTMAVNGGHVLPIMEATWCASAINNLIRDVQHS